MTHLFGQFAHLSFNINVLSLLYYFPIPQTMRKKEKNETKVKTYIKQSFQCERICYFKPKNYK